ncbi:MAG: tRNA pseudouridine(38-40) synthase TruA [Nitrospirota bacterium]
MKHIKIIVQYDGTVYSGWQVQRKDTTIQGLLEDAVFSVTNERVRVTGAGRTDAGVHALEQVGVFGIHSRLEPDVFLRALNANLPEDIRIIHSEECPEDFHPRYDAKNKTYSYLISQTGPYSVFLKRYSWQMTYQLNSDAMRTATGYLIGKQDFSSFRASGCSSKHPVREIMDISISETASIEFIALKFNAPVIKISIQANAFLRHMVRNIAGTLVEIGRGNLPPEKMEEILEAKDRRTAGKTAPACGLFLEKIEY